MNQMIRRDVAGKVRNGTGSEGVAYTLDYMVLEIISIMSIYGHRLKTPMKMKPFTLCILIITVKTIKYNFPTNHATMRNI